MTEMTEITVVDDDDGWFEAEPVAALAPKEARKLTKAERRQEKLRSIEDELLEESMSIIAGTLAFGEVDPEHPDDIPKGWLDHMTEEEATKKLRMAKYGLMSAKEAPVGIKVATQTGSSIIRARATEHAGPKSLSLTMVSMTSPLPKWEEVIVE